MVLPGAAARAPCGTRSLVNWRTSVRLAPHRSAGDGPPLPVVRRGTWRQDMTKAAESRSKLSRRALVVGIGRPSWSPI